MDQIAARPGLERLRQWAPLALLVLALFVGCALRSFALERNPPELFEDELAGAASAWSIVTTGHDVADTHLPFFVTRLELKQPLYGYMTVPFQALLGQTTLAVRLPAVLLGSLTVLLVYWLARTIGRRRAEAALAALVFGVTPWAVHYGRIGWEPSAVLPFTVAGVALLWRGLARHEPPRAVAAAAVLALGAYAYQPALLIHVALALLVVALLARHMRRRDAVALGTGAALAIALLLPYLSAFADPLFTRRTVAVSVFRGGVDMASLGLAWQHYWAQWDPRYLFFEGTVNLRNEPGMGVLLPLFAPFLVIGAVALALRRRAADLLTLGWLLVGPLAAALTDDGVPHFARGIFVLPAVTLAIARGATATWDWLGRGRGRAAGFRAAAAAGIALFVAVQAYGAYRFYFEDYPRLSASAWRVGTGSAMGLVRTIVPSDAVACLDTNAVSYWTFPQQVAWYLHGSRATIVEGLDDARCSGSGAYLLGHPGAKIPAGAEVVARIDGSDGSTTFYLWRVAS